ncbi:hypothetical protein RI054_29g118350 [Pseudoscourfieldia marina]
MSMACDADAVYASCVRLARALDSSEASVVLIRHGESLANVSNVVCSLMHNGIKPEYSLSPKGKQQAHESGVVFAKTLPAAHDVLIYTSPFSRATATAEIFGRACAESASASGAVEQPHVVEWLRERCFGEDAELKPSNEPYERYWRHDAADPFTPPPEGGIGRESVGEVALRTASGFTELLDRIGATTIGTNVVLVAHGDTLSTLAAVLAFCQREESERTIQAFTDALRAHRSHGLKQAEYVTFPRVGVSHETALT